MNFVTQFAGFSSCTPGEVQQRTLVRILSFILFIAIVTGFCILLRRVVNSNRSNPAKIGFSVLVVAMAIPASIGLPLFALLVFSPWCS